MKRLSCTLTCSALLLGATSAHAAPISYFDATGPQNMGSATSWGTNTERDSDTAFELYFDFTSAVDSDIRPIILWEAGGSGTGAALVLENDFLHFFAGNSNDDVVSVAHGLSAGTLGVHVVSVFDLDGGTAGNELLTIYVNGTNLGAAEASTANAWDGGEAYSDLGTKTPGSSYRFNSTPLFSSGNAIGYDSTGESNISFAVYQLDTGGGPVDNTIGDIAGVIPEPSSLALLGLGGLLMAKRRRQA